MVAHKLPRPSLTRPGQPNSVMLLIENQRRPVSSDFLNHSRDGRRAPSKPLGERIARHALSSSAPPSSRMAFQIIVDRLGTGGAADLDLTKNV